MPETGNVNESIEIKIKAEAHNGCYSDLMVTLDQIDDSNFQIYATANYNLDAIVCSAVIISRDTTFKFTPTHTGKYYFKANKTPFPVLYNTILIN